MKFCSECGFGADESVFQKTKGKCPRCYPEEVEKFLKRKQHIVGNHGKPETLPKELI